MTKYDEWSIVGCGEVTTMEGLRLGISAENLNKHVGLHLNGRVYMLDDEETKELRACLDRAIKHNEGGEDEVQDSTG